ncbi:unnamed protein product, partial [Cladocopium goreaui]
MEQPWAVALAFAGGWLLREWSTPQKVEEPASCHCQCSFPVSPAPEHMAALAPGSLMFVSYGEVPEVYHTRLILDWVSGLEYVIATPDLDIYPETMDASNPDFTDCVPALPGGLVPPGINPNSVYSFAPMTAAELSQLLAAGRTEAALERARRGVAAGAAPAPGAAAPVVNEVWVLAIFVRACQAGQVVLIKRMKEEDIPSFCEERVQALRSIEASAGEDKTVADDVRTLETAIMKEKRKMEEAKGGQKGKKSNPKATPKDGGGSGHERQLLVAFITARMVVHGRPNRVFHSPVPDHRTRDVVPLPQLVVEELRDRRVCRSVAKRIHHRAEIAKRTNRVIAALNSLFSGRRAGTDVPTVRALDDLPLNQRLAISDILKNVKKLGHPPLHLHGSEALKALRAASSTYGFQEAGVGDVVPLDLHYLSLPEERVVGVDLVDALPESLQSVVTDFEDHMLQHADVWTSFSSDLDSLRPYDDPSLKKRSVYLDFVREVYKRGIIRFSQNCRGRVGAFTVSKKPKVIDNVVTPRQRLVLDCRLVNAMFRPSPHTNLGSLTALSEMYIPDGQNLFISGADIKDCFYAVRVDDALSDFFGLMQDITGDEVYRATGGECGEMYSDDMFTPAVSVLPMGFSWSFYLVQCIHEHSVCRALDIGREQLVLEGFPAPLLSGGECVAMPYCDNAHVLSFCEDLCNAGSLAAQSDLTSLGFTTHEEEQANTFFKTLGGVVDGVAGEVRTTPER